MNIEVAASRPHRPPRCVAPRNGIDLRQPSTIAVAPRPSYGAELLKLAGTGRVSQCSVGKHVIQRAPFGRPPSSGQFIGADFNANQLAHPPKLDLVVAVDSHDDALTTIGRPDDFRSVEPQLGHHAATLRP